MRPFLGNGYLNGYYRCYATAFLSNAPETFLGNEYIDNPLLRKRYIGRIVESTVTQQF
jgi:hypothetical protein